MLLSKRRKNVANIKWKLSLYEYFLSIFSRRFRQQITKNYLVRNSSIADNSVYRDCWSWMSIGRCIPKTKSGKRFTLVGDLHLFEKFVRKSRKPINLFFPRTFHINMKKLQCIPFITKYSDKCYKRDLILKLL